MLASLASIELISSPAVERIFSVLGSPEIDVRFVGGCVRDTLLRIDIKDIDISTPDLPQVVIEKLQQASIKVVPTGLAYGTVTAICDQKIVQITSLRKDTACDGRHADVEYTKDWFEDASRRDFTFNALSLRPDGTLFDPFGGVSDAMAGRVKFVRDPYDRIQEDYLRILRFFRFQALYGKVTPDAEVLSACQDMHSGLAKLSPERIQGEFFKILAAKAPLDALFAMLDSKVLSMICPEIESLTDLTRLLELENQFNINRNHKLWACRLACLGASNVISIANKLRMSKNDTRLVSEIFRASSEVPESFCPKKCRYYLHKNGSDIAAKGILIAASRVKSENFIINEWYQFFQLAKQWTTKVLPITGRDLAFLGVNQGPKVGQWLSIAELQWIDNDFKPTKSDLMQFLKSKIND
ncbi:MAG: CCA tRNA nucleotidyltransferase [Rhodospirillaceae bacterium]|nr:CCA tRNA nucleotidyltransferase [Rhodospirillaceae bacterium]